MANETKLPKASFFITELYTELIITVGRSLESLFCNQLGDRIIQINGDNVENTPHRKLLITLRKCQTHVILLVGDSKSDKHYEKLTSFKAEVS